MPTLIFFSHLGSVGKSSARKGSITVVTWIRYDIHLESHKKFGNLMESKNLRGSWELNVCVGSVRLRCVVRRQFHSSGCRSVIRRGSGYGQSHLPIQSMTLTSSMTPHGYTRDHYTIKNNQFWLKFDGNCRVKTNRAVCKQVHVELQHGGYETSTNQMTQLRGNSSDHISIDTEEGRET